MTEHFFHLNGSRTLSDIAGRYSLVVVQDAAFRNLGFLRSQEVGLLVCMHNEAFISQFETERDRIAAVITTHDLLVKLEEKIHDGCGIAVCDNPLRTFYEIHCDLFADNFYHISRPTEIDQSTKIHPTANIALTGVRIGRGVEIGAHTVIESRTIVGDCCVIRHGVVLSTEGFEVREVRGSRIVVPHAGGVEIGADVEIQSNTCVSRSIWGGGTRIGSRTKIDNLVHIAHGVVIGERCLIAACATIAGTTVIGDDVWVGPNATVSNGLYVGDRSRVLLGMTLARDLPADSRYPTRIWKG